MLIFGSTHFVLVLVLFLFSLPGSRNLPALIFQLTHVPSYYSNHVLSYDRLFRLGSLFGWSGNRRTSPNAGK